METPAMQGPVVVPWRPEVMVSTLWLLLVRSVNNVHINVIRYGSFLGDRHKWGYPKIVGLFMFISWTIPI